MHTTAAWRKQSSFRLHPPCLKCSLCRSTPTPSCQTRHSAGRNILPPVEDSPLPGYLQLALLSVRWPKHLPRHAYIVAFAMCFTLAIWIPHLIYFWITDMALCVAPFLFNPHQFAFTDFIINYREFLCWMSCGNSRSHANSCASPR